MGKGIFAPASKMAAAFVFSVGMAAGAPALHAQGTDDSATHPAHVHDGTCADLGSVVYPLNDVTPLEQDPETIMADATPTDGDGMMMDATPEDEHAGHGDMMDSTPAAGQDTMMAATPSAGEHGVVESTTIIEATLDELMEGEHALNVHESPENIENYIACGDVAGEREGWSLEIEMQELNDSGYNGRATLVDNDDGTTTVTVTLTQTDLAATPEMESEGTPDSTPMG